ncbi:response regulator [Dictyobacter arantiisoli]|uniref:Response regulatory domain-containing protein n=1 Tax=Dictyobacter arantiisoli TaxID=2014874 RepID=A0A5A5TAA1_9CHLR|nr:response regulator [Dictyobacter arantiisoli]GCF08195.1 hypothetical protein KDI_17590 [Dictyobacter arantiisoli]
MVTTPKVLIIDDSTTQCLYMRQALQGAGYQVLVANDGQEGLRLMKQETPLCLVLDVVLPGMNGFEVCRHIRSQEAWRTVPIVMVSTKNSSSDRFWAMRQGANFYLPKPFKGDELIHAVQEVLQERTRPPLNSLRPSPGGRVNSEGAGRGMGNQQPQPQPQRHSGPVQPQPQRHSGPVQPQPQRHSGPVQPQPQRHSGPVQPQPQRHSGPVQPQPKPASYVGDPPSGSGITGPQYPVTPIPPIMTPSKRPTAGGMQQPPAQANPIGPGNGLPSLPYSNSNNLNTGQRPANGMGSSRPLSSSGSMLIVHKLVPRRSEHAEKLLWASSPEVRAIADPQARNLYMAIDGHSNVETLCAVTRMSIDETIAAIRFLLNEKRIQLYDTKGHAIDNALV